jgi:hypothetical protein
LKTLHEEFCILQEIVYLPLLRHVLFQIKFAQFVVLHQFGCLKFFQEGELGRCTFRTDFFRHFGGLLEHVLDLRGGVVHVIYLENGDYCVQSLLFINRRICPKFKIHLLDLLVISELLQDLGQSRNFCDIGLPLASIFEALHFVQLFF